MLEEWKAVAEAGRQREMVARMKEEAVARVAKKKKEAAEKAEREALAEEDLGMVALEAAMEAEEALTSQVAGLLVSDIFYLCLVVLMPVCS